MMHTRTFVFALFFVAALVFGPGAAAQAQTTGASDTDRQEQIRQLLEERDQEIKDLLGNRDSLTDAQRQELKALINGLIDFRAMGRAALGPHWNNISYNQQEEFIKVFSEIVKEQSLADLEPYRAPVTYQEISVAGDSAYVKTTSVHEGERIPVEYELVYREGDDGERDTWRARDIIVDEVSTVGNYKRSFRSVIRRHGYDALMKSLRKKLKEVRGS